MLVKNAVKLLSKFGEVTYHRAKKKASTGELLANLTSELQIRISAADNAETSECGQIWALHLPSGDSRKERSLNAAIRWCLNKKYGTFWTDQWCGLPIYLSAGINHDRQFRERCYLMASVRAEEFWRCGTAACSSFNSTHPEHLALVHGILEGNYIENVIADFLLENCAEFQKMWENVQSWKRDSSVVWTIRKPMELNRAQYALLGQKLLGTTLDYMIVYKNLFGVNPDHDENEYERVAILGGVSQCNRCLAWDTADFGQRDEEGFLCKHTTVRL